MNKKYTTIVELICLIYHEARNVRHPLKAGYVTDKEKYNKLIQLPNNKFEAWKVMEKVRQKASKKSTFLEAANVFASEYELDLNDLLALYQAQIWSSSLCGGNAWAPICSNVTGLLNADSSDYININKRIDDILKMNHNTGEVGLKLNNLKGIKYDL